MPTTQSPTRASMWTNFTRPMKSTTMQTKTKIMAVDRFSEKIKPAVARMGNASLTRKSLMLYFESPIITS